MVCAIRYPRFDFVVRVLSWAQKTLEQFFGCSFFCTQDRARTGCGGSAILNRIAQLRCNNKKRMVDTSRVNSHVSTILFSDLRSLRSPQYCSRSADRSSSPTCAFPNFLKVTALITGNKNVTHEHRGLHNKVKHPHRNRGLQKCNPQ